MGIESGRKRSERQIGIESAHQSGGGGARPPGAPTAWSGGCRISTRFARGKSAFYRSNEAALGGETAHCGRLDLRTQVRRHPVDRGQDRQEGFTAVSKQE